MTNSIDKKNSTDLDTATKSIGKDIDGVIAGAKKSEGAIVHGVAHLASALLQFESLPMQYTTKDKDGKDQSRTFQLTADLCNRYVTAKAREGLLRDLPRVIAKLSPEYSKQLEHAASLARKPDKIERPEEKVARDMALKGVKATIAAAETAARRIIHGVALMSAYGAVSVSTHRHGAHTLLTYEVPKTDSKGKPTGENARGSLAARTVEQKAKEAHGVTGKRNQSEGNQPEGAKDTGKTLELTSTLVALTGATEHFKRYGVGSIRVDEMKAAKIGLPQEVADAAFALVKTILDTFDEDRWQAEQEKRSKPQTSTTGRRSKAKASAA